MAKVSDAPWLVSKNYDAWGPVRPLVPLGGSPLNADSRKRGGLPHGLHGFPQDPLGFASKKGDPFGLGGGESKKKKKKKAVKDTKSFLDAAMPLILLMQVGIAMPVQRRRDGTLMWGLFCPIMLYSLVVYILLTGPVFYAASAAVQQFTAKNNSFHDQIYNMTPLLLLHAHLLLPVLHWPESYWVTGFFNSWVKYEELFKRVCGRPLHLGLAGWVGRQTALSFSLAAFLSFTMPLYMSLSWVQSAAYMHLYLLSITLVSMWLLSSQALCRAAEALRESMHEVVVAGTCTADLLADYRLAWLELSELTQASGRSWTYSCGHMLLYLFLLMTVTSFGVLAGVARHSLEARTMAYGALAGLSAFTLFVVCSAAETAADRVAQVLREDLLMVQLSDDSQQFKNEVQMFMTALAMDPPVVNLSGYATVNRALFASLLETMVTYLVVLVQFAYSLDTADTNNTTTPASATKPKLTTASTRPAELTTTSPANP